MHWLYRFFWLRTTFRAAFKSQFLAWLRLSPRRGKLGHVSAPRNTGSGSLLRPWAPAFPRLSVSTAPLPPPRPPFPPEHKSQHWDAHFFSLVTCLPVTRLSPCKGRHRLSVRACPGPPAPGRVTEGPCGTDSALWNAPSHLSAVCHRARVCLAHGPRW